MIKSSVDATAVRLIVDEVATLLLKIGNDTYVDFPIYDESFPLVKAGKKFRLTLEEVEGMITGTAGEVDEAVNKGPFCDGCKHIGVNPESGPCAVCFEGMMHESDKGVTMENDVNPDESVDKDTVEDSNLIKVVDEPVLSDTQYNARKRKCGKCANSSNPSACISCIKYSRFEPSRYR